MHLQPFQQVVGSNGIAIITIRHDLHGILWKIYQIGLGLGQLAPSPQVAAHLNGLPIGATVPMQPSAFANIPGQAPYAMEAFYVGPPYVVLSAGDSFVCAVLGANSGDQFTAGVILEERPATQTLSLGS